MSDFADALEGLIRQRVNDELIPMMVQRNLWADLCAEMLGRFDALASLSKHESEPLDKARAELTPDMRVIFDKIRSEFRMHEVRKRTAKAPASLP